MKDLMLKIPDEIIWLFFILLYTVCLTLVNRLAIWVYKDQTGQYWQRSFYHATISMMITIFFEMFIRYLTNIN